MKKQARAIPALLALAAAAVAQSADGADGNAGVPIQIGTRHSLHSKILDEDRTVSIYTPESMGAEGERFPVVYLLDGPAHFHHTTGIVEFLAGNGRMPEAIVVGVANTNRTRDLTPHASDEMGGKPVGGGADEFLSFLTDELSPWIERRYPTRPLRVLIGHSFGGLFGVHALTAKPGFFRGIVAISPSMQWCDQKSVAAVKAWLDQVDPQSPPVDLFLTVGREGGELLGGTMKVSGLLSDRPQSGVRWKFTHMPTETHGSVPHRSTYDGLEWMFEGWALEDPVAAFDAGGWPEIERRQRVSRERFGYETGPLNGVLMSLGGALWAAGRYREIVELFASLDPQHYPVREPLFESLVFSAEKKGQRDVALDALREGLRRFPGSDRMRADAKKRGLELPPLPATKPGVAVPAASLARYAGRYFIKPAGAAMAVRVLDGKLVVDLPEYDKPETAVAKSVTTFALPKAGFVLTFDGEGDAPCKHVTVVVAGQKLLCKRVP